MRAVGASIVILGLAAAAWPFALAVAAQGDQLPTIVTFEMSKAKTQAAIMARNPKGFWVSEIVARIEARKPAFHQKLQHPVSVAVSFVVDRSGKVVSKAVARSSGDAAIDKEALAVLDRAAPFPPMPAALTDDNLAFTMPLRFK